jgi:hypothetical protein
VFPYRNIPRRHLWRSARAYLWSERRNVGQILLVVAACVAVIVYFNRGFLGGLITGSLVMFFVLLVAWSYLVNGDGERWLYGAWAEDWTREALRAAVKDRLAWSVLDFMPLQGGDIDHILIAPGGVIAIETKYFGRASRAAYIADHAHQAARSALRLGGVLRSVKHQSVAVRPLLVVWGPGAVALTDLKEVDGVTVVRGSALPDVLKTFATGRLAEDHAATLAEALTSFREGLTVRVGSAHAGW